MPSSTLSNMLIECFGPSPFGMSYRLIACARK
jgi:hypothetical protein